MNEFEYKLDLLKQEMDTAQDGIKTYNEAQFKVKSFAIPLLAGFLTFAMDKNKPIFLISGVIIVMVFWVQDAYFQSIQRVYTNRAREIEAIQLSSEFSEALAKGSLSDLSIHGNRVWIPNLEAGCKGWEEKKFRKLANELFRLQNFLIYVPLLGLILLLWLTSK